MANRHLITLFKRLASGGVFILFVLFVGYPVCQIGREWYCLKHSGDILYKFHGLEENMPMTVNLLPGQALLFIDYKGRLGYIYFRSRTYGKVDYCLVLDNDGHKTSLNGRLDIWRYFPWQRYPDFSVPPGDGEYVYFLFDETGFLCFTGYIEKVALSTLPEVQSRTFSTNNVRWIQTGQPFY